MKIVIARDSVNAQSITGQLFVNGNFVCYTLERPYLDNKTKISSIPTGFYGGVLRYDHNDKWRIELTGTDNRTNIQIHIGNYPKESEGCILVGAKVIPKEDRLEQSMAAYLELKKAFYGTSNPNSTPNTEISVIIGEKGIEKILDTLKF